MSAYRRTPPRPPNFPGTFPCCAFPGQDTLIGNAAGAHNPVYDGSTPPLSSNGWAEVSPIEKVPCGFLKSISAVCKPCQPTGKGFLPRCQTFRELSGSGCLVASASPSDKKAFFRLNRLASETLGGPLGNPNRQPKVFRSSGILNQKTLQKGKKVQKGAFWTPFTAKNSI